MARKRIGESGKEIARWGFIEKGLLVVQVNVPPHGCWHDRQRGRLARDRGTSVPAKRVLRGVSGQDWDGWSTF